MPLPLLIPNEIVSANISVYLTGVQLRSIAAGDFTVK